MSDLDINIISILVATLSGMLLGAIWYSPFMFGKAWMASLGKEQESLGTPVIPMIGSALSCFFTALALAVLLAWADIKTLVDAALFGGLIAFGVVFPALLSDNLFCGWGRRLLLIQSGYRICYLILMTLIIAAWPE